jgi:hypothetical protein
MISGKFLERDVTGIVKERDLSCDEETIYI